MIHRQTLPDGRYLVLTTRRAAYVSNIFGKATIYKSEQSYRHRNALLDGYEQITNIALGNAKEELPAKIEQFVKEQT